jgi:hypothetical protein
VSEQLLTSVPMAYRRAVQGRVEVEVVLLEAFGDDLRVRQPDNDLVAPHVVPVDAGGGLAGAGGLYFGRAAEGMDQPGAGGCPCHDVHHCEHDHQRSPGGAASGTPTNRHPDQHAQQEGDRQHEEAIAGQHGMKMDRQVHAPMMPATASGEELRGGGLDAAGMR